MTWLDIVRDRPRSRESLDYFLRPEKQSGARSEALHLGLCALQLGSLSELNQVVSLLGPRFHENRMPADRQGRPFTLVTAGSLVGDSCLLHLAGQDQTDFWRELVRPETPADADAKVLFGILARLWSPVAPDAKRKKVSPFVRTEREIYRLVATAPQDLALDACHRPEHDLYHLMDLFVLPLAISLAHERGESIEVARSYLALGAHPERRGELLFSRRDKTPGAPFALEARATWPGFDAIERSDDQLTVYFGVGPFGSGRSGASGVLSFLETLDADWQSVQEASDSDTWSSLRAARDGGRCKYVLATEAAPVDVDPKEVQRRFGIELEQRDIFSI